MKTHLKVVGVDAIRSGQTEFEYQHQTACGYVRDAVTTDSKKVDCKLCIGALNKARAWIDTFGAKARGK